MSSKSKYVSIFKIDGVPILPPLMTKSKRYEMSIYKERAVALETKLQVERPQTAASVESTTEEMRDDFLEVSNLIQNNPTFTSRGTVTTPTTAWKDAQKSSIHNLQKSDTFIYDIKNNTVIIPQVARQSISMPENHDKRNCLLNNSKKSTEKTEYKPNVSKDTFIINKKILNDSSDLSKPFFAFPEKTKMPTKSLKFTNPENPQRPKTTHVFTKTQTPDEPKRGSCFEISLSSTPKKQYLNSPSKSDDFGSASIQKSPKRIVNSASQDNIAGGDSMQNNIPSNMSSSLKDTLEVSDTPKLIRSNSFTLESPSPVLLRHLRNQIRHCLENSPTNETSKKEISRVETSDVKKERPTTQENKKPTTNGKSSNSKASIPHKMSSILLTNSAVFKNKKSPYELKINSKTKMLKKHKVGLKKSISAIAIKPKPHILITNTESVQVNSQNGLENNKNIQNFHDMFKNIKEQHQMKLMELMKRQQDEHKRMQETFEKQERFLLEQINAKISYLNIENSRMSDGSSTKEASDSTVMSKNSPRVNGNHNSNSPVNCVMHNNQEMDAVSNAILKNYLVTAKQSYNESVNLIKDSSFMEKSSPKCSRRLFSNNINDSKLEDSTQISSINHKEEAATKINAFVRGYLVRRLFRTDHVQKIVQTIRDTLLFVLDLHEETKDEEETEENITLKARLLQQLTSACYQLHNIFFQMSTIEKMNIIAKDRIYITTKAQNRKKYMSPRT